MITFEFPCARRFAALLTDDFNQHAFPAAAVEFTVENLLPGSEVETSLRDGDDHFTAHELSLDMRIPIVFAGQIVTIAGFLRSQALEKIVIIL